MNTNSLKEIKGKNNETIINLERNKRCNRVKLLDNIIYKKERTFSFSSKNNILDTNSLSNNSKNNLNHQKNNNNQKLMHLKNNNNKIIINNLIFKNNFKNFISDGNKLRNSKNFHNLNFIHKSILKNIENNDINYSCTYRPLFIRYNFQNHTFKNAPSTSNIANCKSNLTIPD